MIINFDTYEIKNEILKTNHENLLVVYFNFYYDSRQLLNFNQKTELKRIYHLHLGHLSK